MVARPSVRLLVTALAVVITLSGVLPDRPDAVRGVEPEEISATEVVPDPPMVQPPPQPHPLDRGSRTELPAQRTADSRTFQNEDGTFTTEYFAAPVHFQDGAARWVPIEAVPIASQRAGVAFESKHAPVVAELGSLSTGRLLTVRAGEHTVAFLPTLPPSAVGAARAAAKAPVVEDGHVVYADVYPGVDLRYTLLPNGAKEDIILKEPGDLYRFAFVLDAPGLTPRLNDDGSIDLMDGKDPVFHLPEPFMVDSTPEKDGDGVRSNDVAYELLTVAGQTVLVVEAEKEWLNDPKREYPVYIDPTVTASYGATLDTFISSAYPSYNLNAQWNPGEGGYYELWNGRYDAGSGTNYAFVKTTIPSNVSVVSATFKIYVQHAYSGGTATGISIGRLTSAFSESQTWNMTHPSYVALTSTTVADNQWANFNVTSAVQAWVEGTATNHGFRIYQSSTSQSLWKRLRARENSTNKPSLSVTYAVPSASIVGPTGGAWTNGTALDWNFSNGGSTFSQTKFQAQVSTSSTTWSGTSLKADSGVVTSSATAWTAPTTNLTNGTTYYWRVKVFDGHSWSAWSSVASFKRDVTAATYTPAPPPAEIVDSAVTAADPDYYDLGNGTLTVKVRGTDPHSGIKLTYLRLYNATDEMRVVHDWSIGGTHCNEFNTSTLVDATACAETVNSGGVREVTFTIVGLNQNASFDVQHYFTDFAGNVFTDYADSGKNLHFDATAPVGTISSPAASSTVSGSVPITGTASDANFTQYTLHYGAGASPSSWTSITTSTTQISNGTLGSWSAAALANGTYTLRLRVHDKARVSSGFTEVLRTLILDNNLPVATITDPVADAHVSGDLTITGTASASSNFEGYSVHHGAGCSPTTWTTIVNSTTQVTNAPLASWDTAGLNGTFTIRLMVTKAGGVVTTATTCVTVDNTAPSATLTSPAANTPLSGEATILGSATDIHGFAEYELEYGVGSSPTSWTSIGTFTTPVSGDTLAIWSTASLSGVHTLRLTVRDQAGNPPASVSRLIYLENGRRGNETYYTRVPFDMGGGLSAAVGVANGELTLERDLFTIPSYGPPQALSLAYSSLEPSADGRFGAGWSSNLTQYLTFESGFVVWHRADGGRVPFGNVAGTWTPLAGHFETLTSGSGTYTVTLKDQGKLVFADTAPGRLVRLENRFGEALSLTWGSSSATATDASGRATILAIDAANNRITAVTDSAGRGWTFGYTGNDLTAITDPLEAVITLSYDASHRLTAASRIRTPATGPAETILWSFGYTSGKLTEVRDPVSAPSAHTFDYAAGETIASLLRDTAPDPDVVNPTIYAIDASGGVTARTDPEGWTTTQVFDSDSNLLSAARPIDGGTTATTTYTYDGRGNVLTETQPIDASTSVTTRMTYNVTNDLLTRVEADGTAIEYRTAYAYDAAGHLAAMEVNPHLPDGADGQISTTFTYTAGDQLETETDALGRVTRSQYDSHGNRVSETRNYLPGQSGPPDVNVATAWTFDAGSEAGRAGLATSQTDPVGNVTSFAYDRVGRMISEGLPGDPSVPALARTTAYDELGNPVQIVESWTGATRTTVRSYDELNRQESETDPTGASIVTAHDAASNRVSATTADGTALFEYDGLGRVVSETTPSGTLITHAYDAQGGEVETISDNGTSSTITSRDFDWMGSLLEETIDDGGLAVATSYAYDVLGREVSTTNPEGVTTSSTYDRLGRAVEVVVGGTRTEFTFDKIGNQLSQTGPFAASDAPGPVHKAEFDDLDRPVTRITNFVAGSTAASDNLTATTYYDAAGRVVATRDPMGAVARSIVNPRALPSRTIQNCTDSGTTPSPDPEGCTGAGIHDAATNLVTDIVYDGQGSVATSMRQEALGGVLTARTYDGAGRLVEVVIDKGSGALNLTTEFAHDDMGRMTATRDPRGTISRWFYDADGRLIRAVENCTDSGETLPATGWAACAGSGTRDATWNVTTTYDYDPRGNKTAEIAPNGRETRFGYDAADRMTWRIENYVDSPPSPAPPDVNLTTYFYYDADGRQVAIMAPTVDRDAFAVSRFFYDDLGRVAREVQNCTSSGSTVPTEPATCTGLGTANASTNVTTVFEYDAESRPVAMTTSSPALTGPGTATSTTRYAYDGSGRLCRVLENASVDLQSLGDPCVTAVSGTDSSNASTKYSHNANGQLVAMVDAESHATTYTYDGAGRVIGRTDPNGKSVTWEYDVRGNRIHQTNRSDPSPSSPSVTWTYDSGDRIVTRTADGETVTYEYDANGNRISAMGPEGQITSTFDRLNRTLEVTAEDSSATHYTYDFESPERTDPSGTYAINLDAFGREIGLTDPIHPGMSFATAYRADGHVGLRSDPNGNATTFEYSPIGQLIAKTTAGAGAVTRAAYTYAYNQAGLRVTETSTIAGDATNGGVAYSHDPLGRLTSYARDGADPVAYGWGTVPNRETVQVGTDPEVVTAFDDANRPTSATGGKTYSHDLDGQLTEQPGQRLEWDSLGRLTRVRPASGSGVTAEYQYDALDRLRVVDRGTEQLRFRYVGATTSVAQVVDHQTSSVQRSIATNWTGDRLLEWVPGGSGQRYFGTSAHHDVTWLADSSGDVVSTMRYDPWGVVVSTTGNPSDWRFQGSWVDSATELSWVVSRWYDANLGTFISEDTLLGNPMQPVTRHLYAYGEGAPLDHIDPDGHAAKGTCGGLGCTAAATGWARHAQWTAFFRRFPGIECNWLGRCWIYGGTGRGHAMLDFMRWIVQSYRRQGSKWWDVVNRRIVQDSLTAWYKSEMGYRPAGTGQGAWYSYIRSRWMKPGFLEFYKAGYYGGTYRQVWKAHQTSLWRGVAEAQSYFSREPRAERVVIFKVLANVEFYYWFGHNIDWMLGIGRWVFAYPNSYPATRKQACEMDYIGMIPYISPVRGISVVYQNDYARAYCG